MRTANWAVLLTAGLTLLGLGGCSGDDAPAPGDDAGVTIDSGPGMLDSGPTDAGASVTDAGLDSATPTDAEVGTDAGDVDAGACPDINGVYDVAFTGSCGDLSMMPTRERFDGSTTTCEYRAEFSGSSHGVAGTVTIATDGSFMGAAMTLGSGDYTCDGAWSDADSVLVLTCAMTGGSGSCMVTLTRTGPL